METMMVSPWYSLSASDLGGEYLRQFWHPICRSIDLEVGILAPVKLLNEEFVLFRAEDGDIVCVSRYCPHRGTSLMMGKIRKSSIQCMHHGLCFPNPKMEIVCLSVQEQYGLVFLHFSQNPPPLCIDFLEGYSSYWNASPDLWECSFFERLENTVDFAHVPFAHQYSGVAQTLDSLDFVCEETENSLIFRLENGFEVRFQEPNILFFPVPLPEPIGWTQICCFRVPISELSCLSFSLKGFADDVALPQQRPRALPYQPSDVVLTGRKIISGELGFPDVQGHPNLTEIEDFVVLTARSREKEQLLEALDRSVLLFRDFWIRRMHKWKAHEDS